MLEAFANPFSRKKANLLRLQGSLISDMWMEEMGKASCLFQASEVDNGDVIFTSKSAPRITSWPTEMSEDLADALVNHLPEGKTVLSPTFDVHNLDMQHFLRLARNKKNKLVQTGEHTFVILMDTGCSVSCSGFEEDFHGKLAHGDFGSVNTANGEAKIEGFGML